MAQSANLTQCDRKGSEGSIYFNATGTCLVPVWIYHKGVVGDLELTETENENENTGRDPAVLVREYTEDRIELEISGQQYIDSDYEGCNYINSMRSGGSSRDILILDGYITEVGVTGWRGKFRNFDRSKSYPESGPPRQQFRLKPAACGDCKVRPVKVAVAGTAADYDPSVFTPTA